MKRGVIAAAGVCPAVVFFHGVAWAGPFGLSMGMKESDFEGQLEKMDRRGTYRLTNPPDPDSTFKWYMVSFSAMHGLCRVAGFGEEFSSSVYGEQVKGRFAGLKSQPEGKYGEADMVQDELLPNSIWDEPNEWMRSLRHNHRKVQALWDNSARPLPDRIDSILLRAMASSEDTGKLFLGYEFECWKAMQEEIRAKESDGL